MGVTLTSTSQAEQSNSVKLDLIPVAFILEIDAAKYALRLAYTCSENKQECAGVIIKRDNLFYATTPKSGKAFAADVGEYYKPDALPRNDSIVADYHNHICNIHNVTFAEYFSPADVLVNKGLHTRGYMLSNCDRSIHIFDPEQDPMDDIEVDFTSGNKIFLATGRLIDWALDLPPYKNLPTPRKLDPEEKPDKSILLQ